MAESLFDIFGDHHTLQVKNVTRQPLPNIENMGKMVSAGPIKPNEPTKKAGDSKNKKSFLSNAGKVLQSTPVRKAFTPRAANVASLIYSDESDKDFKMEEIEFTKPTYKYDNYKELFEMLLQKPALGNMCSPSTPPPETRKHSMELDLSYHDEFFTDDFSVDSLSDDELGLPALY